MKNVFIAVIIFLILLAGYFLTNNLRKQNPKNLINNSTSSTKPNNMKITSSAFENNGQIPSKYTCDGENINPPLEISDVPSNAKSLVLIVDDPDAPMGTWVHWVLWNINPGDLKFAENSLPQESVQGMTSFGKPGYGGPCPPAGTHHYRFKLYALDLLLSISEKSNSKDLENAMEGHIIENAEVVGLYSKK